MNQDVRAMNAALKKHALTYPEAWEDHPWGGVVAKVGKKIFASLASAETRDEQVSLSVKLPESEAQALDLPGSEPARYGLGKHGWVTLRLEADELPSLEQLQGYIDESYRAIAPKTLVRQLDA